MGNCVPYPGTRQVLHMTKIFAPAVDLLRCFVILFTSFKMSSVNIKGDNKKKSGRPPSIGWKHFESIVSEKTEYSHRKDAKCKFCMITISDARPYQLVSHIVHQCAKISLNERIEFITEASRAGDNIINNKSDVIDSSDGSEIEGNDKPVKKRKISQTFLHNHFEIAKISTQQQLYLDQLLLRFIVTSGIPFKVVENSFFERFISNLRPSYQIPNSKKISTDLLIHEYCQVQSQLHKKLESEEAATILMDGWTNCNTRSVYVVNVVCSDRSVHLLGSFDASFESHTGIYIRRDK